MSTPSRLAASKKMSGAGLLCSTSAPQTTWAKYRPAPVVERFCKIIDRGLELATIRGIPRSSSTSSSSNSPGLQGTPLANSSSASRQAVCSIFWGSTVGKYSRI